MDTKKEKDDLFLSACSSGDIELAIQAITSGADINALTSMKNNGLFLAATKGKKEFFLWLLQVEQGDKKVDVNHINSNGNSLLWELVKNNLDVSYIKPLIDNGADVNKKTKNGSTPLIQAVSNINEDLVDLLLKSGANSNERLLNKTDALLMACSEGNFNIVKSLVEYNANVNTIDSDGRSILLNTLMKPTTYLKPEQKKLHKELISYLVDLPIDVNIKSKSNLSSIFIASYMRDKDTVLKLLDKGANADDSYLMDINVGKTSILHLWCQAGDEEVVQKLLEKGAKLGLVNDEGNTPEAIGFRNPNLVNLLLDNGADVNAVFNNYVKQALVDKIPALSLVIMSNKDDEDVIKKFIDKNAQLQFDGIDSFDPLLSCIKSSSPKVFELLLSTGKIDVNKMLKISAEADSLSYVSAILNGLLSNKLQNAKQSMQLIKNIADANEENKKNNVQSDALSPEALEKIEKNKDLLNELNESLKNNSNKMLDLLIKHGYNLELQDESGHTALFYCNMPEQVEKLKSLGANMNHKDNDGNDLFMWSILNNDKELITYFKNEFKDSYEKVFYNVAFLENINYVKQKNVENSLGFLSLGDDYLTKLNPKPPVEIEKFKVDNINYKDSDGNSPMLVACANNSPFLVSLYYKLGADINAKNNAGETPLMHAIATKNDELVRFLVDNGANVNDKTNFNKSVEEFAQEVGSSRILKYITQGTSSAKKVVI